MKAKPLKMPMFRSLSRKTVLRLSLALVGLILVILLCITTIMRTNIQRDYTSARNEIGAELYSQIYMLCQTFDQVDVPGQDLQDSVLPAMRRYYTAASTLNTAMINAFGSRYSVLSSEAAMAFDSAFDAYDAAFRSGRTTDSARSAMQACVDAARATLNERYAGDQLKPAG